MTDQPPIVHRIKEATGLDIQRLLERFGAPTFIAVLVLTNLSPKIDRGIQIADHVDAELQYLAARGCAPPQTASAAVFDAPPTSISQQLPPAPIGYP